MRAFSSEFGYNGSLFTLPLLKHSVICHKQPLLFAVSLQEVIIPATSVKDPATKLFTDWNFSNES